MWKIENKAKLEYKKQPSETRQVIFRQVTFYVLAPLSSFDTVLQLSMRCTIQGKTNFNACGQAWSWVLFNGFE